MTPLRQDRTEAIRGHVDAVTVSPTGVHWLQGWVTESVGPQGRPVGGLALVTSDAYTGSAATRFTLPDFEATLGPSARSAIGFRLPVLRAVRDTAATFRVFVLARDGRASELPRG